MHVIITFFFVLSHLPLLTFLSCDVHVLCWLGFQKDLRFFFFFLGKIALLSALCMFFKASEKTHSHISSHLTDGLLTFSSYLIFVSVFKINHIIMQC